MLASGVWGSAGEPPVLAYRLVSRAGSTLVANAGKGCEVVDEIADEPVCEIAGDDSSISLFVMGRLTADDPSLRVGGDLPEAAAGSRGGFPAPRSAVTWQRHDSSHRIIYDARFEDRGFRMALKVIGAGLGRTATHSLQLALQQLLDGPCYHMLEVIADPDVKVQHWMDAMDGNADWDKIMKGYVASVDWPASAFWRELADKYPSAPVLLSTRASTDEWFKSFSRTILEVMLRDAPNGDSPMPLRMMTERFTPDWRSPDACKAAYEKHNAEVRASIPADRLIDWQPGDGWEPICAKLGLAVPADPFPHANTTDDFRAMLGLEPTG